MASTSTEKGDSRLQCMWEAQFSELGKSSKYACSLYENNSVHENPDLQKRYLHQVFPI